VTQERNVLCTITNWPTNYMDESSSWEAYSLPAGQEILHLLCSPKFQYHVQKSPPLIGCPPTAYSVYSLLSIPGGRLLYPHSEDAPCHGDRDTHTHRFKHHAMKTYWGSGIIVPRILDLGTRWRWVLNFTHWPIYHRGKNPLYALDWRLTL